MAAEARLARVIGAVNIGSFRISAMVAGIGEGGELVVLGSGHRAAQGIKRGYVTDMVAATYAVRDAVERAEKHAGTQVQGVWIGCSGAGLASTTTPVETQVGGRRIEDEDLEQLLLTAREAIEPDGRMVLHAQPGLYTLDGADGIADPRGLHAERLGVDIHVVRADGAPMRNLREVVQNAHLDVEGVVAAPLAAGQACLTAEERELGVALVEFGAQVTNVSVHGGGNLLGLTALGRGSADITDALASAFGIRRFQAERLKCVHGSAVASPTDHRERIPVGGPGEEPSGPPPRGADERGRIPRAELIGVIAGELARLASEIGRSLERMGFAASHARPLVLTGGGAELAGLADYMQAALGHPVRIGRPPAIKGLAEVHGGPGFATLAGLVLYAHDDPVDIRAIGPRHQLAHRPAGFAAAIRVWRALKENF